MAKIPSSLSSDPVFNEAVSVLQGKSDVLDNIMSSMGDGLSIQDRNMRIVYQNKFMVDAFGSHIGAYCYNVYENRDTLCENCPVVEAYETENTVKALRIATTKEKERFRFENIASVLRNSKGKIVAGIEPVRIVEERERALEELRAAMEKLSLAKAVYESSSEGIMVMDQDDRIISINPAFERITGYSHDEVVGIDPGILRSGRHSQAFYNEIKRSLDEIDTWQGDLWNKRKDGQIYAQFMRIDTVRSDDGTVTKRVCIFSDTTEKKLEEEQIKYMALHDALTDLPNRTLFTDRLHQALTVAQRNKASAALLYIDLDEFKPVNDRYGHKMGDLLLKAVAQRLTKSLRKSETISRLGGDEFAVLLPEIAFPKDALIVAEKIRSQLEDPFIINGKELKISSSIGCAVYPDDGQDDITLTQNADQAMYKAKQNGRNRVYSAAGEPHAN